MISTAIVRLQVSSAATSGCHAQDQALKLYTCCLTSVNIWARSLNLLLETLSPYGPFRRRNTGPDVDSFSFTTSGEMVKEPDFHHRFM
ncbi:hypothetical protein OS493_029358 [Desmophyllum pertusum]|uniref:Uncharacterized protein n=1 Tax=Desmophyllum pertusum TaxID=174260 RepID=A0A9X0CPE9_9CNID|nr:hypothetical protein OS493_029358 [Desmophyllum pertusum]